MENTVVTKTFHEILLEKISKIVDYFGHIQTAWGLIVAIVFTAAFIYALFSFRKIINKRTKSQIQFFIKVKKYEPSLYIELNQNMEFLRYFLFGYKWEKRIVYQYNKLFNGYEGKRLKECFRENFIHKVSCLTKMCDIKQRLKALNEFFESISSERESYKKKLGEYVFVVRNLAYDYSSIINTLLQYCDMITSKALLLVGSAGNGKTNLLCRISEIAINNKIPVMLINSRDINKNCKDYILSKLPIPSKLKWLSSAYLYIISFFLLIKHKNFYIFIDAINENDREVFVNSIGEAVDYFLKYPRIRIVLTCRSEYFESRYKNYFNGCEHPLQIFDIMARRYDDRALGKIFSTYRKHFNVLGTISYHAKNRLIKSLFLMRIFFEVNSNHDESVIELRNAELYLSYLQRIDSEIKTINFIEIIEKIASVMIEDSQYNHVTLRRLGIGGEEKDKLFQVLDDNLIISRTLLTGQGITKNEDEVVTFVFDEFRDFCLARYLLQRSESEQDDKYTYFFDKASEMFLNRQSPVEGVIKYAYYYFKSCGYIELSKKILTLYSETDIQDIFERDNWYDRQHRNFRNYGLSLIFIDGGEIIENEVEFLKDYIAADSNNYWNIFWFLLANEYSNVSPRLELGMRLLIEGKSFDEISKVVECLFADRHDYRYHVTEDKRKVNILRDWLKHIEKQNKSLSRELKQFMVLLCAIDPYELALGEYKNYVMEDFVYTSLLEFIQCAELLARIQELRASVEPRPTREDALHGLLQFLMQGGGPNDN